MVNLEKEAAIIAHALDKPFDFPLKQRIIAAIISSRNSLLRQSIVRNRDIPIECIQTFALPIQKAEPFSLFYKDDFRVSARTINPVPKPLRLNSPEPFISVTSLDGSIAFDHADFVTVQFHSKAGKFISKTGRYAYHAEHVALYHNEGSLLTMPMVLFRGIMEDPLDVNDYANHYTYTEENFPMPSDMMNTIRKYLITEEFVIPPADRDITIDGRQAYNK